MWIAMKYRHDMYTANGMENVSSLASERQKVAQVSSLTSKRQKVAQATSLTSKRQKVAQATSLTSKRQKVALHAGTLESLEAAKVQMKWLMGHANVKGMCYRGYIVLPIDSSVSLPCCEHFRQSKIGDIAQCFSISIKVFIFGRP
jgi:hypothetical protein